MNLKWLISIIAFFSMAFIFALFFYSNVNAATDENIIVISVQEGDTLWGIAKKHHPNKDIRKVIYQIEKLNNISKSMIYPGQQLKIPIN
ncbi:MAG: LysM peptidoglycan-binding domain-containing protein [Bacillota bacterium]